MTVRSAVSSWSVVWGLVCCLGGMLACDQELQAQPAEGMPTAQEPPRGERAEAINQLPMLETVPRPTLMQILEEEPRDWIVTHAGRVLIVPAISPRPDHLEWLKEQQKNMLPHRPQDPAALDEWREEYRRYDFILIEFEEAGIEADFRLPVRHVAEILYHEHLALELADRLIREEDLESARRLISFVAQREFTNNRKRERERLQAVPWPGLIDVQRRFLVAEVRAELKQGNPRQAYQIARMHWTHDPSGEELDLVLGEILSVLAPPLIEQHAYRELRFYLTRVREMVPSQERALELTQQLQQQARERLRNAEQAGQQGENRTAALLAATALEIWPHDNDFVRRSGPFRDRYPMLRVGLLRQNLGLAEYRRQLLDHQWFHVESIKEGYPRYRSRFVESWVPDDLGKTVTLTLRQRPQAYESQPAVTTTDLFTDLARVSVGSSPVSRGLFADAVLELHRKSPTVLQVRLHDQTPHPLGWLAAALVQSDSSPSLAGLTPNADTESPENSARHPLRQGRFQTHLPSEPLEHRIPEHRAVRARTASGNVNQRYLAEVQDFLFEEPEELLRSLLRDELDYLPEVPADYVSRLSDDERFRVHAYSYARSTILQFHLRGQLRGQGELRQALLLSLNREDLLRYVVPEDSPAAPHFSISNSLIPPGLHSSQPLPHAADYDPIAARALAVLLLRNPRTPRVLKLATTRDAASLKLAEQVASVWRQLGLQVELLPLDQFGSATRQADAEEQAEPDWDARIVSYSMLSPLQELPGLLTDTGRITVRELQTFPLPIRRSLLQLESSRDWNDVNQALGSLQTELGGNGWMHPLWHERIHAAVRREVRRFPTPPLIPAQAIDTWSIGPVVPRF